jgi:hypothetical protein
MSNRDYRFPKKGRLAMDSTAARHSLFEQTQKHLAGLAYEALLRGMTPREFMIVCIHVDDLNWTDLVEVLMPNSDWQQFRDRGEMPLATGIFWRPALDYLMTRLPDTVAEALRYAPPKGKVHALVMASGGVNLYEIEPIPEGR